MLELEEFAVYRGKDEEEEILLHIEAHFTPGESMITSGPPDHWRPASPNDMEITKMEVKIPLYGPYRNSWNTRFIYEKWDGELTEEEHEYAVELLYDIVHDQYEDAMEAKAEAAMEAREARYYDSHGY